MNRAKNSLAQLRGAIVPLNICFQDDGVDFNAVCDYVDWLCTQQVPVILLTYGSTEFAWLSDDDLWQLTEQVGKAVDGRSMFITSTEFWLPKQTREFLKHADACGADAVKVQVTGWDPPSAVMLQNYFDDLSDRDTDIPLLLWWHPLRWSQTLPSDILDTFCGLAKRSDIIGIKNDGDAFYDYKALIRGTNDQDFAVISGGLMQNMLYGYGLGSPAYLCPIAPFRPDLANQFFDHVVAGRLEQAQQIINKYEDPVMDIAGTANWLCLMKSAIMMLGFYDNNRVGNPSRTCLEGEELERVKRFYTDVFGVKNVVND
ncbi:MAG: dihydrodipicolinate synthase family protein [Pirellulaceae bacterium]|nr:dihydrodipicolinate synthase family protein [Pirellulaceae bacterium]